MLLLILLSLLWIELRLLLLLDLLRLLFWAFFLPLLLFQLLDISILSHLVPPPRRLFLLFLHLWHIFFLLKHLKIPNPKANYIDPANQPQNKCKSIEPSKDNPIGVNRGKTLNSFLDDVAHKICGANQNSHQQQTVPQIQSHHCSFRQLLEILLLAFAPLDQ